mmetsp:Transcript_27650/g.85409  ORF Transcript_27650/g.85409 Transcript_27650/m.85409 type:complete len:395 (-) Transcript_27650:1865-3049(-)
MTGPWIVHAELQTLTLRFLAYHPKSSASLVATTAIPDVLLALLTPRSDRYPLPSSECRTSLEGTVQSLAHAIVSWATADARNAITNCISATTIDTNCSIGRRRRLMSVCLRARQRRTVTHVACVLGARVALRQKRPKRQAGVVPNFVALRLTTDDSIPLTVELFPSSTLGEVIREALSLRSASTISKVMLCPQQSMTNNTAVVFANLSESECINERATALLERFAADRGHVQVVRGPAIWISPSDITKSTQDSHKKSLPMSGLQVAKMLIAHDEDTRKARRATKRAFQDAREFHIRKVAGARMQWTRRAKRRILCLMPWLERASRIPLGSGDLASHGMPPAIRCIASLRAHAEKSKPQDRHNIFDVTISGIRYYKCPYVGETCLESATHRLIKK